SVTASAPGRIEGAEDGRPRPQPFLYAGGTGETASFQRGAAVVKYFPRDRHGREAAGKMEKVTMGILAHVDAGKTTLSEGLLYRAGAIRTLGRVDHRDAFLDTDELERERGITIFAHQAQFTL